MIPGSLHSPADNVSAFVAMGLLAAAAIAGLVMLWRMSPDPWPPAWLLRVRIPHRRHVGPRRQKPRERQVEVEAYLTGPLDPEVDVYLGQR